jgi:hypothetical protein
VRPIPYANMTYAPSRLPQSTHLLFMSEENSWSRKTVRPSLSVSWNQSRHVTRLPGGWDRRWFFQLDVKRNLAFDPTDHPLTKPNHPSPTNHQPTTNQSLTNPSSNPPVQL